MGLFSAVKDSVISAEINKAASELDEYQRTIHEIINHCIVGELTVYDIQRIAHLNQLSQSKLSYIENKMHSLASDHLYLTMVRCPDGKMTAVPHYILMMKDFLAKQKTLFNLG